MKRGPASETNEHARCTKRLAATGLATSDRLQRVVEQLREMLKDGPRLSRDIHEEARRGHLPRLLLFAAKEQLGVRAFYDGTERQWRWALPGECPVTTEVECPESSVEGPVTSVE